MKHLHKCKSVKLRQKSKQKCFQDLGIERIASLSDALTLGHLVNCMFKSYSSFLTILTLCKETRTNKEELIFVFSTE